MVNFEGDPENSPEAIAAAWDEEIARRVADMVAGRVNWAPAAKAIAKLRARIAAAKADVCQSWQRSIS
jgi:hypothetical protein